MIVLSLFDGISCGQLALQRAGIAVSKYYASEINPHTTNMINNYCEHEWENICCQCTLDKIYCHKCDKSFDDL